MSKNNKCSKERLKQMSDALDERSLQMSLDFDSHIAALDEEIASYRNDKLYCDAANARDHYKARINVLEYELSKMTECAEKNGHIVDEEREITHKLVQERDQLKLEVAGLVNSAYKWKEQAIYRLECCSDAEVERDRLRQALVDIVTAAGDMNGEIPRFEIMYRIAKEAITENKGNK